MVSEQKKSYILNLKLPYWVDGNVKSDTHLIDLLSAFVKGGFVVVRLYFPLLDEDTSNIKCSNLKT